MNSPHPDTGILRNSDTSDTGETVKAEVPASPANSLSDQNHAGLIMIENLDEFRMPAGGSPRELCLRCGKPGVLPRARREGLQVCDNCYWKLQLTATPAGRKSVEKVLESTVPPRYRLLEFQHFRAYTDELKHVFSQVVDWVQKQARGEPAGSIYLHSSFDKREHGCGVGKTMLMYSAYKYVARRRVRFSVGDPLIYGPPWGDMEINFKAFACDLKAQVLDPFMASLRNHESWLDTAPFDCILGDRMWRPQTVDECIGMLAGPMVPLLFLDDVGRGSYTQCTTQLYENLLHRRANDGLPTFVTSNHSPEDLEQILGQRTASRIRRNDCQVLEITARDYALVQGRLRKTGGG